MAVTVEGQEVVLVQVVEVAVWEVSEAGVGEELAVLVECMGNSDKHLRHLFLYSEKYGMENVQSLHLKVHTNQNCCIQDKTRVHYALEVLVLEV
jgi:hypothetical protein